MATNAMKVEGPIPSAVNYPVTPGDRIAMSKRTETFSMTDNSLRDLTANLFTAGSPKFTARTVTYNKASNTASSPSMAATHRRAGG